MKDFPHQQFRIVEKLRQHFTTSTFVVQAQAEGNAPQLLKLYSGAEARAGLVSIEQDLRWQKGLVHPFLSGINNASISGKYSFYTTRPFAVAPLDLAEINITHIRQLLDVMGFLHAHNRPHGRLRPSNLFIVDGKIQLVDLRLLSYGEASTTEDISFTAPEVLAGKVPGIEADYYSLGAILYKIYAGRDPFVDSTAENLKAKYLNLKIPSLRNWTGIRESAAKAIEGLLSRNSRRRITAYEVLLREFPFQAVPVERAPMVGRCDIMESICSWLASPVAGTLNIRLIEGDAGIGKSRLIEDLQFQSTFFSSRIFKISCVPEAGRNLAPIFKLVYQMLLHDGSIKDLRSRLGSFADSLAPLFEEMHDENRLSSVEYVNDRIVQSLIGLVGVFSRQGQLRLCIEDIDQADSATLMFLRQLCCRAPEFDVRLLLTCRKSVCIPLFGEIEGLLGEHFKSISMPELDPGDSRRLVHFLAPEHRKQPQKWKSIGGNPLWILEYAGDKNAHALATRIYALISKEVRGESLKLIQVLSILREPISMAPLARVVDLDLESVRRGMDHLKNLGMIHEGTSGFKMRPDSLRSKIESEMSPRLKRSRHRLIYNALKTENGIGEPTIAHHAFQGGLWGEAALYMTLLARSAVKRGDNIAALAFYEHLEKCLSKTHQDLPIEENIQIATCLAKTGRLKLAERIYKKLLGESETTENLRIGRSLLYRGADIDRTHLNERLAFLRDAIESSQFSQPHPSVLFSKLTTALVKAGDFPGATDALVKAQLSLVQAPDKEGLQASRSAEGFLFINAGKFKDAAEIYQTLSCETLSETAAAMTNRSYCLEQLGDIRGASTIQNKAYECALRAGHIVGQLLCLGNLGVFYAKLGNFKVSREQFENIRKLVSQFGSTMGLSSKGIEAEEAALEVLTGEFDVALERLHTAVTTPASLKRTRLQCLLLDCEIKFAMAAEVSASDIDKIGEEGAWSPSPLYRVQLAILRSRVLLSTDAATDLLKDALATARSASLLYEICRLELELGARCQGSDPPAAKHHADEAIRIARKNGYRPLLSRALLLRGISAVHDKEKEHFLVLSFKLATEVEIPEVVSESAYHLGILSRAIKQHTMAREYFANSTRTILDIAGHIPDRYRAKYLSKPWRRDARRYFQEYAQDQPVHMPSAETEMSPREHPHFRALYRISVASAAQTVEGFIREMLPAIVPSQDRLVVMLKSGDHTAWYSRGISISDGLRKRVQSLSRSVKGQLLLQPSDRWIPFRSVHYSGGILAIGPKGSLPREDEMEFFTILGTFAGSALDQINNRTAAQPVVLESNGFYGIVGKSRRIREMCATIETVARSSATVLIQGETGTGKELVARAIHQLSTRAATPFIALDCGAIAENLIESELFGSARGSFTGATSDRPGVFEAADRGTLFLDEISNMNPAIQARLLRVLQEREIRRVGETRSRRIDVRLIAASNTSLRQLAAEGAFRQDLLFRLNVMSINVPPLRERREDIPELAAFFLNRLNVAQRGRKTFGSEALRPLLAHPFFGNIRELQNCIERSYFMTSGNVISSIRVENGPGEPEDDQILEIQKWLSDLSEGRKNFWTAIHDRYRSHDISREKVTALIDLGLRTTRGSYKSLASLLHIEPREYRRLMDFLRRNKCLLDFRPYRKADALS